MCQGLTIPTRNANPKATALGVRFITEEMMDAYGKLPHPDNNEATEAAAVVQATEDDDVVADLHNNPLPGMEFMQIDPNYSDPRLVRAGAFLGFTTVLTADSSLFKAIPQALPLEFSVPNTPAAYEAYKCRRLPLIRRRLTELAAVDSLDDLPEPEEGSLAYYQRAGYIFADSPLVPEFSRIEVVHGFQKLPGSVSEAFGTDQPLYATSWGFNNQSEGRVFGGVAIKLDRLFEPRPSARMSERLP